MDEATLKAEERARADSINTAIAGMTKKPVPTPTSISGISTAPASRGQNGLYYAVFLVMALMATALAYLFFVHYIQNPTTTTAATSPTVIQTTPHIQPQPAPQPYAAPQPPPMPSQPVAVQPTVVAVTATPPRQPTYTPVGPTLVQSQQQAPAPAAPSLEDHADAAEKYALNYFRYKYRMGTNSTIATSVAITPEETSEVPGWSRYRTKGQASFNYYTSGGGFKNGSVNFEVLTEVKNGKVHVIELNPLL